MVKNFTHQGNPTLLFGKGSFSSIPGHLGDARKIFVLTGGHFPATASWKKLERNLSSADITIQRETVIGEPDPETVDALTAAAQKLEAEAVIAIGGGSVLDAGKAVAAMLHHEGSVFDYLEGVGSREPEGRTAPMIAVPTTAGTGSEATKNAVISRRGSNSFKKSLRHDAFIPKIAVIDPELAIGCPPVVSRACGMDAFSQLLESFVSTGATPFTDIMARDGLRRFSRGSRLFSKGGYGSPGEVQLREDLALAAYYSGLTLANAGLGTVHGLAGPLGAFCEVPHGVACGLLVEPAFRRLTERAREEKAHALLDQLAFAGAVLTRGEEAVPVQGDVDRLLELLEEWSTELPRLSSFGLKEENLQSVVAASGNKNFPIFLDESERKNLLAAIL